MVTPRHIFDEAGGQKSIIPVKDDTNLLGSQKQQSFENPPEHRNYQRHDTPGVHKARALGWTFLDVESFATGPTLIQLTTNFLLVLVNNMYPKILCEGLLHYLSYSSHLYNLAFHPKQNTPNQSLSPVPSSRFPAAKEQPF